jgi:hypothetical protein
MPDNRLKILLAIIVVAIIAMSSIDPIAQDPSYHDFADRRAFFNIANFFNVLSNAPFVIIGIMGIRLTVLRHAFGGLPELHSMYLTFFIGVLLTGFGSGYYHLQPNNQTLLWDRLPMTIAFMALFSAIIGEYISIQLAQKIFAPLLFFGAASVLYWYMTELDGHGDLRPYVLVQFLPVLLIPLILWLFDSKLDGDNYIWGIIAAYATSKLMELFDAGLYNISGLISGHSLKHLTAAFATLIFYWALQQRHASR